MSVSPDWNTHGECGWCGAPCWCGGCHATFLGQEMLFQRHMYLCPDCGNKRCPKATHHDHQCTGSNKSGQKGSAYA